MNSHALFGRCPDGSILEIGTVAQLETACRLRRALEDELGDEYVGFWIEDVPAAVSAVSRDLVRLRA
jgi:hypothetical protein